MWKSETLFYLSGHNHLISEADTQYAENDCVLNTGSESWPLPMCCLWCWRKEGRMGQAIYCWPLSSTSQEIPEFTLDAVVATVVALLMTVIVSGGRLAAVLPLSLQGSITCWAMDSVPNGWTPSITSWQHCRLRPRSVCRMPLTEGR